MAEGWSALGYLLVLSTEMVFYMVSAVFIGKWLNDKFSLEFDGVLVTVPLSLLLSGWSLYRFFGKLIKKPQ